MDSVAGPSSAAWNASSEPLYRVSTLDYYSFVVLSWRSVRLYCARWSSSGGDTYQFPESFLHDIRRNCFMQPFDVFLVCFLAVLWTVTRIHLTKTLFLVSLFTYSWWFF